MKVNMLFFIIFTIFGLLMVITSIILKLLGDKKYKACTNKVQGKVIKYTIWNNNGVHFPIIEYIVNGISYKQKLKYGWIVTKSSSFHKINSNIENDINSNNLVISENSHISTNPLKSKFPIGTLIDVYYDPKNPKTSYVMKYVKNPCIMVLLISGIFFMIMALIGLLLMPNNMV